VAWIIHKLTAIKVTNVKVKGLYPDGGDFAARFALRLWSVPRCPQAAERARRGLRVAALSRGADFHWGRRCTTITYSDLVGYDGSLALSSD
jgi:hypothetical protein